MLPGDDKWPDPGHASSVKRLAVAAGALVFVAVAPVAQATVANVSPPADAIVPSGAPITFSWSTNNLNSPVFGGRVHIVVTRNGVTFWDRLLLCPSGGTNTCPSGTVVDPDVLPPGTYAWHVRWWIFVDGPPNEIWDASTPTGFTVADAPPPGPPPAPEPPPPAPPFPLPPAPAPEPTAPRLTLDAGRSIRLRLVGPFVEARTTVTVDRAATLALTVAHPRTGVRLRLSARSQIGPTVSGRPHSVLRRLEPGSARLAVRIRLPLAALRHRGAYVARISATNEAGTTTVSFTLRR